MKHGDKAKAKAAKASQPSDKKASSKSGVGKSVKAEAQSRESAAKAKTNGEKGSSKKAGETRTAPAEKGGSRAGNDGAGVFANPLIAAAFKRAVKKYPNSFRRLTD